MLNGNKKNYNQTHGGYIGRWRIGRDMLIKICQERICGQIIGREIV